MATQANRPMREQVEFPFNVPVPVTLKYSQGKSCANGDRVMYTTSDNRVMFLDFAQGRAIEEMSIRPGEPLLIARQKPAGSQPATWLIQRAADLEGQLAASLHQQVAAGKLGQQPDGTFVVPAAAPKPPQSAPVSQPSSALVNEANALVDAYAQVLERTLNTYQGRIKPEEARSLLISAYIQRQKSAA